MAAVPVLVHVVHSLAVGGTENGVVNVIRGLQAGFRHVVVALTEGGPLAARLPEGTAVHALGKRPGLDPAAVLRLVRVLRRIRPTIVHSRNWGALDAVLAARMIGVPVVLHGEHGREASDPFGLDPRRNRIRRLLAPLVDRFVTVSLDLRSWLVQTVRVRADRVVTIHNGVDTERFATDTRAAARKALGSAADSVVIGTVGRLDPVKDHVGLLDAFAALRGTHRCELVIVGDGPCRSILEARAAAPDLAGRVRLLGERMDVASLLSGFDLFALPSLAEGISNTVLEAMACGLPVVATRTGGNPELVVEGVTGALVPVGDRRALARALTTYVDDSHLRALHGKAGRDRAVERFSLAQMTRQHGDLYRALIARAGA